MCKTKMAVEASDPNSARSRPSQTPRARPTPSSRTATKTPKFTTSSSSDPSTSNYLPTSSYSSTTSTTLSSRTSLSSLRDTLPENPHLYDLSEIRAATNNFLAKRHSSSSTPSWRGSLRGRDCIIFQRKFRRKIEMPQLRERLSVICRSHHASIIKLLGASVSGDYIYLVYDFVHGANLAECLRNQKNPNFTVLSTWISRMQIATDIAHGFDYIHNKTGLNITFAHNHLKSSSIMVTEPSFNAKICHFGAAQLCGETDDNEAKTVRSIRGEIEEMLEESSSTQQLKRSDSNRKQFEGVRGYMSPEFQSTGIATRKSDVYAFGVVVLELLSGDEPFKYKFDRGKGEFMRTSLIETAADAIDSGGGDGGGERLRRWVDRRLKDSFPVEVAVKLTRVALDCVDLDPDKRPDMGHVAGKISKLYLQSKSWSDKMKIPTEISVSLAPR
ncbi:lysM domain receptor-like kinase 3 [Tripterygium wilfordii]|uniref:lysM domain receptor-like kinase 3 n=1 Tax=Tripterygium wilfordii TaxID=458696 RepID=UPI0018F849B4|nr:lysM domain receptor-like kinase 3 [Tripterygium wilfordii]XP_038707487.1 lysM domain receptor-like kinase 3 [Tripterygium wilfordii]